MNRRLSSTLLSTALCAGAAFTASCSETPPLRIQETIIYQHEFGQGEVAVIPFDSDISDGVVPNHHLSWLAVGGSNRVTLSLIAIDNSTNERYFPFVMRDGTVVLSEEATDRTGMQNFNYSLQPQSGMYVDAMRALSLLGRKPNDTDPAMQLHVTDPDHNTLPTLSISQFKPARS